jgi:hypothetical protein
MPRRVFFSFHYERDLWRAGQVRNSWVTKPDREAAGFWDAAAWEEVKKKGEEHGVFYGPMRRLLQQASAS